MQRSFTTRRQPAFRAGLLAPGYWPTWTLYLFAAVMWMTPRGVRALLARAVARVLAALPSRRRTITLANLHACFPEQDDRQITDLLRRHVRIQCEVYLAYGELLFSAPARLAKRFTHRGVDQLEAARQRGRNIILMMPHCCAFEFGGQALVLTHSVVSMARLHEDNDAMDWVITRLRCRFGGVFFGHEQSMVPLIKAVRDGYWMFYLPDEDRASSLSVFAPFFGVPKLTTATVGRLAHTCRADVFPVICRYHPDTRRFEIDVHEPMADMPSGDGQCDAVLINEAFETLLAPDPAQYAWTQKIFRTRPEGAAPIYPKRR